MKRGLRNNNPLNIERTCDRWQGMAKDQTDPRFVVFVNPAYGYRAALVILRNYYKRYGLRTLREILHRWAPPVENDTDSYVRTVSRRAKILPNAPLDLWSEAPCVRLLEAMTFVENGVPGVISDIKEGFEL